MYDPMLTLLTVVLAHDFDLRAGRIEVKVPDVITGSNYSLVCEYQCLHTFHSNHMLTATYSVR